MPYINIDIDVDDFYDELNSWEKQDLIRFLKQDGLLASSRLVEINEDDTEVITGNPMDHEWVAMMAKISSNRYQLTPEQEMLLINLAKEL